MNLLHLLPPISASAPCGGDPDFDPTLADDWDQFRVSLDAQYNEWTEYRRAKHSPTPDAGLRPPNWLPLQNLITELAAKTKHLPLAVALTECLVHTEGLRGLRDGLLLITAWSTTWWDHMHPGTADRQDIERRADLIENLNGEKTVKRFETVPLMEANEYRNNRQIRIAGPFSMEDLVDASRTAPADETKAQLVRHTFAHGDPIVRETSLSHALAAREAATALVAFYEAKNHKLALGKVIDFLDRVIKLLRGTPLEVPAMEAGGTVPGAAAAPAGGSSSQGGGPITSRSAASGALDSLITFFRDHEPSSPVPYLLQRAQRCIGRTYLEIVDELGGDRVETDKILKPLA